MHYFEDSELRQHRSFQRPRAVQALSGVALCLIGLFTIAFTARAVVTVFDPDWDGSAPEQISLNNTNRAEQPAITVNAAGQIVAVWRDQPRGESWPNIYYTSRSDDQGKNWSMPTKLSDSDAISRLPHVISADGSAWVAWTEEYTSPTSPTTFEVYEAKVDSDPISRLVPIPDADRPSGTTTAPRLAASPDALHLVFNAAKVKGAGSHIYYSARDFDSTWPEASRIYTSPDGTVSWFPVLAVEVLDGELQLHVVWERQGEPDAIMYMSGTPDSSEVIWEEPIELSSPDVSPAPVKPDIVVTSGGDVHIVWGEEDEEDDGYYVRYCHYDRVERRCSQSQRVDSNPVYINEILPSQSAPRLAVSEHEGGPIRLCIAWPGFRNPDDPSPEEDVVLTCSEDGGDTWEPSRTMSAFSAGEEEGQHPSIRPSVAFGPSGTLYGAWQQRVDIVEKEAYYEIYYSHSFHQVFLPLVIRNG